MHTHAYCALHTHTYWYMHTYILIALDHSVHVSTATKL